MPDPETDPQYVEAAAPYLGSECAVKWSDYIWMRSWRYVLEISSACNLRCTLCHAGNREGYQYTPGIMDMDLMEKILDKIQKENPEATVCAYVNSEPFLHPRLGDCIRSIKRRGLKCEIATNGNFIRNVDDVLSAKPDLFTVSVSGFTQGVYERAHRGGNIEAVKENILKLVQANRDGNHGVYMGISYHLYKDNLGEELDAMRKFSIDAGLILLTSFGRTITMENTVQALRYLEFQRTGRIDPYPEAEGRPDLNAILPPPNDSFLSGMGRLIMDPVRAVEIYRRWPISPVCIIADVFTEIRHDGRVQLCAWTDDLRLTLGHYLEMSQDDIRRARRNHPLCRECMKYRMNLYFHIVDRPAWKQLMP